MIKRPGLGWMVLAMVASMSLCASHALAKGILVTDLYGEPDVRVEAGAVSLLVRTVLATGEQPAVERARVQQALEKLGVKIRSGLTVPPGRAVEVLKEVDAQFLVSGVMARRGTRLLVTMRISDGAGKTLGVYQVTAASGDVAPLARELSARIAKVTKTTATPVPEVGVGELRPFVAAAEALADKDAKDALDALAAASPGAARDVLAARSIGESIMSDRATSDTARSGLLALLDPTALGQTEAQLAVLTQQSPDLAALVRGQQAHAAGDKAARDVAITPLVIQGDVRTLRWIAGLPSGALPPALEEDALAAAERLNGSSPSLSAALALRAARGGAAAARTLPLLRPSELAVAEIAELQPVIQKAAAARDPVAVRLQAELAIRAGDLTTARGLLGQVIAARPDDAIAQRLLGRVLTEQGELPAAIAAFRAGSADGNQLAQRELARALIKGGEVEAGQELLRQLASDARSVESRVAAARGMTAKGMGGLAVSQLEEAFILAPDDVAVLKSLGEAYETAGDKAKATEVLDLLAAYENAEDVSLAAALDLPDASTPTEVAQLPTDLAAEEAEKAKALALREGGAVADVAGRLEAELAKFAPLTQRGRRVLVVPRAGSAGGLFYSLDEKTYEKAVVQALTGPPFEARVIRGQGAALDRPNKQQLRDMLAAAKAEVIVSWRIETDGSAAKLGWFVYDGRADAAFEAGGRITGDGLVHLRLWWPLLGLLVVLGIAGAVAKSVLTGYGSVVIKMKTDAAVADTLYSLAVNKQSIAPELKDVDAYVKKLKGIGPRSTSNGATHVGAVTKFHRIRPGAYFAHVFGTHVKGEGIRTIKAQSINFKLLKNGTSTVEFDLVPLGAEYRIGIYDGSTALSGAIISIDQVGKSDTFTGPDGSIIIEVPRGRHTLIVSARGMTVERVLDVTDTKSKSISINLERERALAGRNMDLPDDPGGGGHGQPHAPQQYTAAPSPGMSVAGGGPSLMQIHDVAQGASLYAEPRNVGFMATAYQSEGGAAGPRPIGMPPGSAPGGGLMPQGIPSVGGLLPQGFPSPTQPQASGNKGTISVSGLTRYQAVEELGRGAMGTVYKAKDTVLERMVALKMVSEEVRKYPVALTMFQQEAKALAALNHPNVVMVFDQGKDGEQYYMVMEFVEGRTLESILEQTQRLGLAEAMDLVSQLCAGLAYAHGRRIIHRDIKPANVFVTNDGIVKLGDFGLARVMNEVQIHKTEIRGTPLYMAPEQIRGADIDFRADLYAVGCTMYELVTGRPPFIEGEILYHHIHTTPQPVKELAPEIPDELAAIIMQCLEKDKHARVASADAIRAALRPLIAKLG